MITSGANLGGYVGSANNLAPFPIMLGRDIYNQRSMTGQNRSPVQDLINYAVSGVESELPIDIDTICEALIVDGSLVVMFPAEEDGQVELIKDVYVPSPDRIIKYLRADDGSLELEIANNDMSRLIAAKWVEMRLEGNVWTQHLFQWAGETAEEILPEEGEEALPSIPADMIFAFPNGRGNLYWAQDIYQRLQENAQTQRETLSGVNLLPVAIGDFGDQAAISTALDTAQRLIVLPGDGTIERSVANNVAGLLQDEAAQRRRDWLDSLNVVEQDSPDRPVASDRSMRMGAMKRYLLRLRRDMRKVYAGLGVTEELNFDKLVIDSGKERLDEKLLLDSIKADIGAEEYTTRVKML